MRIWLKRIAIALLLLGVIQVVRPARSNPPIDPKLEIRAVHTRSQPAMDILERSCNDCHSNHTVWPWYSNFAPVSWLVAHDVRQGRREMNLSQWGDYDQQKRQKLLGEMCAEVSEGGMPGTAYEWMHRRARLTNADVQAVCAFARAGLLGVASNEYR
ncbi:MAG: heme-binding domain-containing protein [Acidobacteriia bacterium]|nr:heme-binding domain-containing protein [Terriglobia bacterium]